MLKGMKGKIILVAVGVIVGNIITHLFMPRPLDVVLARSLLQFIAVAGTWIIASRK